MKTVKFYIYYKENNKQWKKWSCFESEAECLFELAKLKEYSKLFDSFGKWKMVKSRIQEK